ncbi:MAG: hypothetical protein AAF633_19845, partial [Chloroflexota bacterium]
MTSRRVARGCGIGLGITVLLVVVLTAVNFYQVRLLATLYYDILSQPVYLSGLNGPEDILAYIDDHAE